MNDRGLAETFVTLPVRPLRQGEVNLHVAAAEAEALGGFGNLGRNIVVSQSRLLWTTSAPNSTRRRRPRRRYAFAPRLSPAGDQSSVPSMPKTSSACAPMVAIVSLHGSPSPSA